MNWLVRFKAREAEIAELIQKNSRFANLKELHFQLVGTLIYIRLAIGSGDAAGHNMVTAAAENLLNWVLSEYPTLRYISISGNFCTDKKPSAVNGILGRGKYVVAEIRVPADICATVLKTTPEKVVELHIKKNLVGTMLAGACVLQMHILPICYWRFIWQRDKMRPTSLKGLRALSTLKCARGRFIFQLHCQILSLGLWAMARSYLLRTRI